MAWIVWGPEEMMGRVNEVKEHLGARRIVLAQDFMPEDSVAFCVSGEPPAEGSVDENFKEAEIVDFRSLPDTVRHSRPPIPSDWAIGIALEAADLANDEQNIADTKKPAGHPSYRAISRSILAHARLIEQTQPAPVAIELQCARDALAVMERAQGADDYAEAVELGAHDDSRNVAIALKAIELYKERTRERD